MAEKKSHLPVHVALIMDGNRRWARAKGKPGVWGHRQGVQRIRDVLDMALNTGISYLTFFAFSTENWHRTQEEVSSLLSLFRETLRDVIQEQNKKGIRIRIIGEMDKFPEDIQKLCAEVENTTQGNSALQVQIALNYGGRAEILHAVRSLLQEIKKGACQPEEISEEMFSAHFFTAGIPDPDLLIRTGGERRLSNFLLWQMAYTEFVFIDKCWPDFAYEDFQHSLEVYANRQRRYGT
ncbi:MAG: di-trans,poly-cis-decaprenylcistransferase [Holosporales bacterium]|jgi:undecaprenyl diphosphate synthase|nr:di-trans,poly-cis-decaprenylcistransferase [Holosporales bacterium]